MNHAGEEDKTNGVTEMMTPGGKQNIVIEQRGNGEKLTEARAKPGKEGVKNRYPMSRKNHEVKIH